MTRENPEFKIGSYAPSDGVHPLFPPPGVFLGLQSSAWFVITAQASAQKAHPLGCRCEGPYCIWSQSNSASQYSLLLGMPLNTASLVPTLSHVPCVLFQSSAAPVSVTLCLSKDTWHVIAPQKKCWSSRLIKDYKFGGYNLLLQLNFNSYLLRFN